MKLSQMFQTELCQCTRIKQFGKVCKSCGFGAPALAIAVGGVTDHWALPLDAQDRVRKAVEVMVEDEMERARR